MKKTLSIAFALLTLLSAACSKEDTAAVAGGTGVLEMRILSTRTDAEPEGGYDPAAHTTVRIYNAEGGLLRKYSSQEDLPEGNRLELLAGSYRVAVEMGEQVPASTEVRYYTGERQFDIVAGEVTTAEVECRLRNTVVEVRFDETIARNFGENYYAWTVIADAVDEEQAASGAVPALRFTADGKGYFTLPADAKTLAWKFSGEHLSRGSVVKEGTQAVVAGGKYVLTFRYSDDLPGYIECFSVRVDPSTDDQDDTIVFSPDPTLEGEGFDTGSKQDFIPGKTADKSYKITTMAPLLNASLTAADQVYDLLALAATRGAEGIAVERINEKNLRVTLTEAFFAGWSGGEHTLSFRISDSDGGLLEKASVYRLQGVLPVAEDDYDLWSNRITLRALVLDPEAGAPVFGLRTGNGAWHETDGTAQGNGIYTAQFSAEWEQSQNEAGLTVHTPVAGTGVFAGNAYEARTVIGGASSVMKFSTAPGDTIYNAGMELWSNWNVTGSSFTGGNVAYPNENGSTVYWVGSNNGNTKELCTGKAIEGNNGARCAQLHPQAATGDNFAAGSLFTGTIDFGTGLFDMFGYARFGIQYTFTARPKALRVHYKAVITQVTHTGKSSLTTSDHDPARIFVCITDWTDRHAVKSGVSFDENTFWDPVKVSSLGEGPILGYGSKLITASTDGWVTEELPIVWYDKDAAPGRDRYSLSISAASSAYGDYMGGSLDNYLYIEDFEWVY